MFEVNAMGTPLWGEFLVINNMALQHRVLLLMDFPLLKLCFKKLLALFLTVIAKLGPSTNRLVDKRKKKCCFKINNYDEFEA